jgi:putative N-acetylmannosamine-6-phosphate epimerase
MENWQSLQRKLIAAARANPPSDRVPYAFEKRMMALLAGRAVTEPLALWVRGLWRAAVSCVAVALLLGAWAIFISSAPTRTGDLSQNFESTLLASVDQGDSAQ